jgi:hypothetical protein
MRLRLGLGWERIGRLFASIDRLIGLWEFWTGYYDVMIALMSGKSTPLGKLKGALMQGVPGQP